MSCNRMSLVIKGGVKSIMELEKTDWVLLTLRQHPLDRIHLMKALFLIWHRSGRNIRDYFLFLPYLYGPCSFEVYSVLENLQANRFIVQPPHLMPQWVNYYLSDKGKKEVEEVEKRVSPDILRFIKEVANEVSRLSFHELLRKVYTEAPDFAVNAMFRGIIK